MSHPGAPSPDRDRRLVGVLLVVSGATFLDFLDVTVVNLAFPSLRREFGGDVGDLAWVITGYAVAFAALLAPSGRMADVAGRRGVFLVGTLLFLVASLASALAPSLGVLVAARFAQGAGAAMTLPAGLAILLAASPPHRRGAAIGIWGASAAVAALVGPTVGGVLVEAVGWRAVFLINVPIGIAILVGAVKLVPASSPLPGRRPDLVGAVLLALGIGSAVLAVTQAPDWGWLATSTVVAAVAGVLATGAALARALRHPAPAIEVSLWRIRDFSAANAASLLFGGAVYAWMLVCVLFLTEVWRYSELEAGLAMSPGAISAGFAAVVVGRRLGSREHRPAVAGGAVTVAVVGLWLLLNLGPEPRFLEVWLPAGLVVGVGMGAAGVGISAAVAATVPPDRYAAATGLNLTARQVGGALGIAVLAAILQAGSPDGGVQPFLDGILMCSVASLLAAAAAMRLSGAAPRPAAVTLAQEG